LRQIKADYWGGPGCLDSIFAGASFSKFPGYYKDYVQTYPATHGQANTSAMGQAETALTRLILIQGS